MWKEKGFRDKVDGNSGCGIVMSGNAESGSRLQTLVSVLSQGRDFSQWDREINLYLYRTVSKGMFNKTVERFEFLFKRSGTGPSSLELQVRYSVARFAYAMKEKMNTPKEL